MKYVDPDGRKTNYSLSSNGKVLLKKLEGCVKNEEGLLIAYNDSKNFATKGYGILIQKHPLTEELIAAHPPQTEEEATIDLENALVTYELIFNNRASYTWPDNVQTIDELVLSETQVDALLCLTYNFPDRALKVMNAIRAGKTQEEVKSLWMEGFTEGTGEWKRHSAELKLFIEGIYEENPYN